MKIVVNGREYSSPNEMPADVREGYERAMAALADKNDNGIPDILETHLGTLTRSVSEGVSGGSSALPATTVVSTQKFVINGHEYDSIDQMPPEVRRQFEQVQSLLAGSAQPSQPGLPPVLRTLDPLDPAQWTPSRGLLATNPMAIMFVVIVLTAAVTCGVLAAIGALRW